MKLWPRMKLQIGWADLAAGGLACLLPGKRDVLAARAESFWPGEQTLLNCKHFFHVSLHFRDTQKTFHFSTAT